METDAREGRLLKLTVTHVDVKLYRSSRTSSLNVRQTPHFDYFLRIGWSGSPKPAPTSPRSRPKSRQGLNNSNSSSSTAVLPDDSAVERDEPSYWWDSLPSSYTVKRRWLDIVRFHEVIEQDLVYDKVAECRRIKARMPNIPSKGDLDAFVKGIAATGDVCVLKRSSCTSGDDDHLRDLHSIYVENRLRPYFAEVCKVLDELPAHILANSLAVHKFVTDGVSIMPRYEHEALRPKNCGPQALALPMEDRAALALRMRKKLAKEEAESEFLGTRSGRHAKEDEEEKSMTKSRSDSSIQKKPRPQKLSKEARRRQRLEASHYGFFANNLEGPEFGDFGSTRDFWLHMHVKERRELGRRTLLSDSGDGDNIDRLPKLPPPGKHDFRASVERPPRGGDPYAKEARASVELEQIFGGTGRPTGDGQGPSRQEALERDICEGLRVVVLGQPPPQNSRGSRLVEPPQRDYEPPNPDDTLKMYKAYQTLISMEEGAEEQDGESDDDNDDNPFRATASFVVKSDELDTVTWNTFFTWSERELDFARDFRYKSIAGALNRALRLWWLTAAGAKGRMAGVSLTMLLQWAWPGIGPDAITNQLMWICHHELDKIRKDTPRIIEPQQRRQLETIFKAMDSQGQGFCTPDDIAGGKIQDIEAKLKNIVDVDTVRAVTSLEKIGPISFLELMCQDGYRAHADAKEVLLDDGRRMVHATRAAVGFEGWIFKKEDIPPWELPQRRLIDALENEVLQWRQKATRAAAAARARAIAQAPAPSAAALNSD